MVKVSDNISKEIILISRWMNINVETYLMDEYKLTMNEY
jgi:hypothetical protein